MKRIAVMAYEDPTRPGSGYAKLVLSGISHVPDPLLIELRLNDASRPGRTAFVVTRIAEPLASRIIPEGLELTFGPELTEMPELVTGVEVQIVIHGVGAFGEFLWPDIASRARPGRRLLMLGQPSQLHMAGRPEPRVEAIVAAGRRDRLAEQD